MVRTCVDSALEDLKWLEDDERLTTVMKDQIQILKVELRFIRIFLLCMANWIDVIMDEHFGLLPRKIEDKISGAAKGLYGAGLFAMYKRKVRNWELLRTNLLEKINDLKPEIRVACDVFSKCLLQTKSAISAEIAVELLDPLLENLNALVALRADMMPSVRQQIEALGSKLKFLRKFISFTSKKCKEHEKWENLLSHVGAISRSSACLSYLCWVDKIDEYMDHGINVGAVSWSSACLSCLCWVDEIDEYMDHGIDVMLSDLLQNLMPNTQEVLDVYLGLLKASKLSESDVTFKYELVTSFVDFLLDNLMVHVKDEIEILHDGLVFLIVYLMDPLGKDTLYREKMLTLAEGVVGEAQSVILYSYKIDIASEEMKNEVSLLLSKVQQKVKFIMVEAFLMELLKNNSTWMVSMKNHISALHEGFRFIIDFLMDPPEKSMEDVELMFVFIEQMAKKAGALIDSIDGNQMTENMVLEMNLVLVKLFEHIKLIKQVEFLLKQLNGEASNLVSEKHRTGKLDMDLIFLKAFLMELPEEYKTGENPIFSQIEAVAIDTVSLLHSMNDKATRKNTAVDLNLLLSDLLQQIKLLKAEVSEVYLQGPSSTISNFPRTDGAGFVEFLIGNLKELLNYKFHSISQIKNQVETILRELESLRSFLEPREQEEIRDIGRRLMDVAYQAEYAIDLYLVKGAAAWFCILWLSHITEDIMIIKRDASRFSENTSTRVPNVQKTSNRASSLEYVIPRNGLVVGLDNKVEDIRNRLLGGSGELDIIPIVGAAGLGKTTLAKHVYDDSSIIHQFHIRAWSYVSQVYQARDLVLDILVQVSKSTDKVVDDKMSAEDLARLLYKALKGKDCPNELTTEDLADLLCKKLRGKKYLIVLDDIWDVEVWESLRLSFPVAPQASRIIFTSRLHNLASQAGLKSEIYSLRLFTEEECSKLLQKMLFHKESWPEELSVVGAEIARKCDGLPFVVVVIAGVLAQIETKEDQWKVVEQNLGATVPGDPQQFIGKLDMSYNHLPDHLKACFLYLGAFAFEKEIPVWKLTSLWIAEGFVRKPEVGSSEDVAESYLTDLINRSLVMVAKRRSNGRVKTCHIHNLVRDFCLKRAAEESFLQPIQGTYEVSSSPINFEQHRLSIYTKRKDLVSSIMHFHPCARSLLFFPLNDGLRCWDYPDISLVSHNFKVLRVLDLGSINLGDDFPSGLTLLIHLRYLAIRGNINSLPSSIVNFGSLETLLVKGLRGEIKLPDTFWNMSRLRHVQITGRVYIFDDYEFDCFIEEFLSNGPSSLDSLEVLSTLSFFSSRAHRAKAILRRLSNLQKLRCVLLELWNNRFPELNLLSKLESLKVVNHGYLRYPCDISLPKCLKKLTLSQFRLPWKNISMIGRLPNLEVLKLLNRAFLGPHWDMKAGEFPKLKYLKLSSLKLEEWTASSENFPCLEQLVLQRCEYLKQIPSCLQEIPTLQYLEVQWCSQSAANSAVEIQKEQLDFGNEALKVLIHPQHLEASSSS